MDAGTASRGTRELTEKVLARVLLIM